MIKKEDFHFQTFSGPLPNQRSLQCKIELVNNVILDERLLHAIKNTDYTEDEKQRLREEMLHHIYGDIREKLHELEYNIAEIHQKNPIDSVSEAFHSMVLITEIFSIMDLTE